VNLYEQAGVAGIQLEDQVMPKRCGHMSGKDLVDTQEMVGKIRAAVQARRDPDLVLVARTDAIAVNGLDDAIARAHAHIDAGADVLFIEAPTTEQDIAQIAAQIGDCAPLLFNWVEGGRTPALSLQRITDLGYRIVIFPIGTVLAATAGMRMFLQALRADGTPAAVMPRLTTFEGFTDLIGLPEIHMIEERFRS
jgi:2-methylisocitrate lyase-like PEP mutase family enzyme